jgi:hypothetical protein
MSNDSQETTDPGESTDWFAVWLGIAGSVVIGICAMLINGGIITDNDKVGTLAFVAAIVTLLAIFYQIVDARRSSKEQKQLLLSQSALMDHQNRILERLRETLNKQNELLVHQNTIIEYQNTQLNHISYGINVRSNIK